MTTPKHSVQKLPKLYKIASRVVQKVKEEGGSVKSLLYQTRHPNLKGLYALVLETLKHNQQLDYLVRKTQILLKNPKLNPWVARVLMTELLWQKRAFSAVSPPQEIVLGYHKKFLAELPAEDEVNRDTSKSAKTAARPIRYIRVNTLKDTVENVVKWFINMGWEYVTQDTGKESFFTNRQFRRDTDIPNLLLFPHNFRFYETELYEKGVIILQDKASCVPPLLLNPPPGSVVLDMCAAPGMKTSQLAAIMENKGKVIAVEINKDRYVNLCATTEKYGATCVETVNKDVLRYSGPGVLDVEYILLDPPCSGSGMTIREDVFSENTEKDANRLTKLANFQSKLLRHSMTNFPNVKRIVYSTCSVHPEENEAVVESVLKSIPPNFIPIRDPPSTDWMTRGSSDYEFGDCSFYTRPDTHLTNGFFVIVFDRSDNEYVSSSSLTGPRKLGRAMNTSDEQSVKEESVPLKKGSQQKKKGVKNGLDEEKLIKPGKVVQKKMKTMQEKSESQPAVKSGGKNQKKNKKSEIVQGDLSSDMEEDSVETAVVEQEDDDAGASDAEDSRQIGKRRRKSSLSVNGKKKNKKSKIVQGDCLGSDMEEDSVETAVVEQEDDDAGASDAEDSRQIGKRRRKSSLSVNGKKKNKKSKIVQGDCLGSDMEEDSVETAVVQQEDNDAGASDAEDNRQIRKRRRKPSIRVITKRKNIRR